MVDELGESKDELRKWSTFQAVTKLKNYITSTQVGEMSKCHLSKFPVWPSKGRSEFPSSSSAVSDSQAISC